MGKTANEKTFEILYETEKVADRILFNKKAITDLSQKKEDAREAYRALEKSSDEKTWITIGGMMVKVDKTKALDMLQKGKKFLS